MNPLIAEIAQREKFELQEALYKAARRFANRPGKKERRQLRLAALKYAEHIRESCGGDEEDT